LTTSADEEGQLGLEIEDDENDNTTSDEEDDEVTDFGTPATLHYVKTSHNDDNQFAQHCFPQSSWLTTSA
jgi:hypothetical protein